MDRPNILVICVEHWSGRLLGAAGHPCVKTPTLDQLARNGILFTNAYSGTPTCIPARRALMTGTTARTHGDRIFNERLPLPDIPSLAGAFAEAGYQTYAVGKLHVYPQRDRIGFHDALINEEGRHHLGLRADDYEIFLAEQGFVGQECSHGMSHNDYLTRPWHLPEYLHATNWTVREMCRFVKRRDPNRPGFWFMSFSASHPPLIPPAEYVNMYRNTEIPEPIMGDWSRDFSSMPYALKLRRNHVYQQGSENCFDREAMRDARIGYYALSTHLDHQIRLAIGILREEKLLDNTVILFLGDHGEMLGNHGLFAKDVLYEDSARIPMILVPTADYKNFGHHQTDDRLVEMRDVMPTLLDMADLTIPPSVEGNSLLSGESREILYCEHWEDARANRMVRNNRYKLIYYPVGNRIQLFDLAEDPDEMHDLADDSAHAEMKQLLTGSLIEEMYGTDEKWIKDDTLVGIEEPLYDQQPDRGLGGQRGWRFP